MTLPTAHRIEPGSTVDLSAIDPRETNGTTKAAAAEESDALRERLSELHGRLWGEGERSLLVVLQAMDTGGKDGTVRKVIGGLNPAGVHVWPFGVPTEEELAHDFLWRIHAKAPGKGQLVVFNRSHYEDVLVVRVKGFVPEAVWRARYDHIVAFERLLAERGTQVVKVFLHISRDEQRERLQARLDDPTKRWKFRVGDLDDRALWDDFQAAYAEALGQTSTSDAPWYVVPADRKWYRDVVVLRTLVGVLEHVDPRYPTAEEGLEGVVIPE